MWLFDNLKTPSVQTPLPGPKARALLERDAKFVSPSYTRAYPLVVARGSGAVIEDVDGNRFLDLTAGIAVTAAGHCHPQVVAAIKDQADKLLHMSGTDFYYQPQIDLAQRLAEAAPGPSAKRVFFTNSGAEALEAALETGPLPLRPHSGHRLPRRVPRADLRGDVAFGLEVSPPSWLFAAGPRHSPRSFPPRLSE